MDIDSSEGSNHSICFVLPTFNEEANIRECIESIFSHQNQLKHLLIKHPGVVLLDTPGLNPFAKALVENLGFEKVSNTFRMYRGEQPPIKLHDVYGLACLELG